MFCCCWCVLVERQAGRIRLQGKELFSSKSFSRFFLPLWLSPLRKSLFVSLLLRCQWNWMILAVSAFLMNIVKHMDAITPAQNLFTLLTRIHMTLHKKKLLFCLFSVISILLNMVKGRHLTGQTDWNSAWMVHSFTSVGTLNDCSRVQPLNG